MSYCDLDLHFSINKWLWTYIFMSLLTILMFRCCISCLDLTDILHVVIKTYFYLPYDSVRMRKLMYLSRSMSTQLWIKTGHSTTAKHCSNITCHLQISLHIFFIKAKLFQTTIKWLYSNLQKFITFPSKEKKLWTRFSLHSVLSDIVYFYSACDPGVK